MKQSLRVKLSAAFISVALILFILISLFANFFLERQFKEYTLNRLQQRMQETAVLIAQRYQAWGDKWDVTGIENIGVNALGEGLILRVKSKDGAMLWDARVHNNGMCMDILKDMAMNMQSHNPNFKGGYEEKSFPLKSGDAVIGNVDIGYYGPYFYSDMDLKFLATLNNLILWAALISLLVCFVLGTMMAKRIARPMQRVVETAGKIAKGNYEDRIDEKTNTKEILELTGSINSLAQTLKTQEILRKRLTADVSHELRTPLATLQSHVEAFMDGVWEPDAKHLKSFHEEILRLSKLVGELEKLSRYEAEEMVLTKERFELSSLLQNIVRNFEGETNQKGVTLTLNAEEQWIEADKDKVSQIFINLISNALKYTPAGGSVAVELKGTQDMAAITVRDTGIGIAEQDLPHIFERFYRTDRSRNRSTGGAGIGLTIARSLAEAHKGSVTAESKTGEGSIFTVMLPKYIK